MKFRTFILPLAIGAGLVLVLGIGLLGGLALRSPLYLLDRGGQATPEALQFVPKQSVLVASVLTRPDRLAQLWDYLADPKQRQALRADRERLERALLAQTGLTYEQDIQPWLGNELTAALVTPDLDHDPSNGKIPGYLAVLSCKDPEQARSALELFWQGRALAGEPLTFEDLGGTRLIYSQGANSSASSGLAPLATAMVANRFILAANDATVLRQAITAAQAKDNNLAADGRYRVALKQLSQPRVGLVVVNLPQINQWLHPDSTTTLAQVPASEQSLVDWGLISLGLDRQGILADAAWVVAPGHRLLPRHQVLTDWYPLARYLPESLGLESVGLSLAELGDQVRPWLSPWVPHGAQATTLFPWTAPGWLGQLTPNTMLENLDQRYALGVDLDAATGLPQWLLISPSSAPTLNLVQTLEQQAQTQGLGRSRLEISGYPTTVWTRLSLRQEPPMGRTANPSLQVQTDVVGLRAELSQDQVLTTSPEMMAQALANDQRQGDPPTWTHHLSRLPAGGESHLHLQWPSLSTYLQRQVPQFRLWETVAHPALKHLQSITLTSYGQTDQVQHAALFIELSNRP